MRLTELTTAQAGQAIGLTRQAMWNHIEAGRLRCVRRGVRGLVKIDVDDLRRFCSRYLYDLDEEYLSRLANQETVK
jgi:hypothetical protein